jgi:Tol biopolymer transport system component
MMRRSLWISLLLPTCLLFGCAREARKSISPELENKIVFLCSEGICTINSDGSDRTVIVSAEDGGPFSDVQWSPDKRRIGFTGHFNGRTQISLVDSEGSNRKVLSLPYNMQFRGWSCSGKYILGKRLDILDGGQYYVMTTKGKIIARLVGSHPTFGGSDKLIYAGSHGGAMYKGSDIFVYDLHSGDKQSVTDTHRKEFAEFYPEISNDGTMITYLRYTHPREVELWIMHSDGTGKRRLAISGKDFADSRVKKFGFSPNGDMIMFISSDGQIGQIYIINADGKKLRPITDRIVNAVAGASWSPDGKQIVFTSDKDGNAELYVVNIDGTGPRRLTNNSTMDCCPDW